MSDPLVTVALYTVPALLWTSMFQVMWHLVRRDRPRNAFFRTAAAFTGAVAAYYFLAVPLAVLPGEHPGGLAIILHALRDASLITGVAVVRHVLAVAGPRKPPPGSAWLAGNYGLALVVAALAAFLPHLSAAAEEQRWFLGRLMLAPYFLVMLSLSVRQMTALARPGAWRPGGLGELRRADLVVLASALIGLGALVLVVGAGGWRPAPDSLGVTLLDAIGLGVIAAVPLAARIPSELMPHGLTNAAMFLASATIYLGAHRLGVESGDTGVRPLVDLAAIVALVAVLGPGRGWLRSGVYAIVLRRSRRRWEEMGAFLRELSADLGVLECCRRAVDEIVRVMQVRAIGVLLSDGESVVCGSLSLEPLARVWPRGASAEALPRHPFGGPNFWDLPGPIQESLEEAGVVGVVPIVSPRRRWGDLVATAGYFAPIYTDEDIGNFAAFADQLALVLDGAELVARAVAVERSLAHAEKLAAIGETAARIAHEIRNPVTAARSLAQQLAREPGSPFAAEHAVILGELERVERHVAALLRFARRDELRLEPVDLAELTRTTIESLRARLDAAGIEVALDLAAGVVARADREKVRQVLVNGVENALDALAEATGQRTVALAVGSANGTAIVRMSDSGPGVPPEALPRLFEPFFSLKPTGTGLGLAIARHTVEAHGGRITATSIPGQGMTLAIELPMAGGGAAG
jgi:signal transduction histidine kinase